MLLTLLKKSFWPLIIITGIMIIGLLSHSVTICAEYKTVKTIGGCSAFGDCGVEYTDGTQGIEHLPSKNKSYCVNYKTDWKLYE